MLENLNSKNKKTKKFGWTIIDRFINRFYWKRPVIGLSKEELKQRFKHIFDSTKKGSSITLDDVTKVYPNGIKAVDRANLKIKSNEFICLLGPSGCGKTTILRMIAGLETISSGLVKFDGSIINSVDPGRRNLAMVFQNYALYPFMSVYKNISFGLKIKSRKNHVYAQVTKEIKELKHTILYRNKLLKHELFLLRNSEYDDLKEIETALKIKAKAKLRDEDFKILLHKKNEILSRRKSTLEKNGQRILFLQKLLKNNKSYLNAEEITELELKSNLTNSIDIIKIKQAKSKSVSALKVLKKKNKKIIRDKLIYREELVAVWKANIPFIINNITTIMGINNYINRKPAELSGGQRQRVALARAISKNSSLFLYDEPLSNLDAKLRVVMRQEIRKLHDSLGTTSLYVTHDQIEAMTMADRIVVMNSGYIQQVDTPQNIYDHPANIYVATFVGTPEMNIFKAKMDSHQSVKIEKKIIRFVSKLSHEVLQGEDVLYGIRPDDIITNNDLFGSAKGNVILGKVLHHESTGKEIIVLLETELGKIRVVYGTYSVPSIGEKVKVMLSLTKSHLFDFKDGLNLTSPISSETQLANKIWKSGAAERIANKVIIFKEKNKTHYSTKMWRAIYHLLSPKAKHEFKQEQMSVKIDSTKDKTLVEQHMDIEKQKNLK